MNSIIDLQPVQTIPPEQLQYLVRHISFPASRRRIVHTARRLQFPAVCIRFLKLFAPDVQFTSGADLIAQCEDLGILHEEEAISPVEFLRSP